VNEAIASIIKLCYARRFRITLMDANIKLSGSRYGSRIL